MTDHVFKVGDKGKTDSNDPVSYGVTAVGEERMLVRVFGYSYEILYYLDGAPVAPGYPYLIPPKRRIQGTFILYEDYHTTFFDGYESDKDMMADVLKIGTPILRVDVDQEEGEGLDHER